MFKFLSSLISSVAKPPSWVDGWRADSIKMLGKSRFASTQSVLGPQQMVFGVPVKLTYLAVVFLCLRQTSSYQLNNT